MHFAITVARGFGSGGKEVAYRLADQLGIHCYENRILTLASQMTGLDESQYVAADENLQRSYVMSKLAALPITKHFIAVDRSFTSNSALFQHQVEIIQEIIQHEDCVIVGKCADYVLKDYPNVISVYIEAGRPACRQRTMDKMKVTAREADRIISQTDKYRADYYRFYTKGGEWTNPINYDMTLNSDKLGIQGCVTIIQQLLEYKKQFFK